MGKEEILNLNTFLLAGIPEIITQEEFDNVKKAIFEMLKENKKIQKENEKLHHYKTLYQSLKRQKEELRSWLYEGFSYGEGVVDENFIEAIENVLEKMEELESVKDE